MWKLEHKAHMSPLLNSTTYPGMTVDSEDDAVLAIANVDADVVAEQEAAEYTAHDTAVDADADTTPMVLVADAANVNVKVRGRKKR